MSLEDNKPYQGIDESQYDWWRCKGPRLVIPDSEIGKRLQEIWEEQQKEMEKDLQKGLWGDA